MEEDIKILEEIVFLYNYNKEMGIVDKMTERGRKEAETIKKLLEERQSDKERIKKLEEENAMLKRVNNIAENITTEEIEKAIEEASKEFIPVALVKEKIEEKKEQIDKMNPASDCVLIDDLENQIEVLEELLKEDK